MITELIIIPKKEYNAPKAVCVVFASHSSFLEASGTPGRELEFTDDEW